ncbi:hypothetical protein [Phycicoccus sp.]|uniref:hypothetical protein n=1 Tax=Phycicoccus sp. TaxID=1902410 RepID=UPI002C22D7BC|nr:hypothetical protein [Phycicoccus sp.]HMM96542.1 hypothetical protein [Phycicoccus sp.]
MAYNKAWRVNYERERAQGHRRYVPAEDTRVRLQTLVDAHVSLRTIARASGLSDTSVGRLVAGEQRFVRRTTARRVAALRFADVFEQESGNVPSIGTIRRIQALMAIGWRKSDLEAAGVPASNLITRPDREWVAATGWRRTRDVYDRLSMTPGPSQVCRDRARARGYLPPLAWDDDTIDDPRAVPATAAAGPREVDQVAVDRAVAAGTAGVTCETAALLTPDERLAAIRVLALRGSSDTDIARAVGVVDRTVLRLRQRNAIESMHPAAKAGPLRCLPVDASGTERLQRSQRLSSAGRDSTATPLAQNPGAAVGL